MTKAGDRLLEAATEATLSKCLIIGAYRIHIETSEFGAGYVVRRSDRPALGHCYPTMALAIHHARRLNRKYPQRSAVSTSSQEALP